MEGELWEVLYRITSDEGSRRNCLPSAEPRLTARAGT
jgi:hypothetical protein